MNDKLIFSHERVDDLQLQGLKLIQNPGGFCFGVDAVLLADYASKSIRKSIHVLDLCTGSGIVPVLLSAKTQAEKITGIEIQKTVAQMACRSVKLNRLEHKISIVCDDLKNAAERFGKSSFQYITCNPPYKKAGSGILNRADETMIARHEILCSLDDIIRVSSIILEPLGKLCLIHRPDRLVDIITAMKHYGIEPKRLRFVHPYPSKTASMILIEGTRHGKPQLFLDPPLYIYEKPGVYSKEIQMIYEREELQL